MDLEGRANPSIVSLKLGAQPGEAMGYLLF